MKAMKSLAAALTFVVVSAAAQPPAQAAVDPEQKAAVKELLEALNFKQSLAQMAAAMSQSMPQMADQMIDQIAADGKITAEQKAEAKAAARNAQASSMQEMVAMFNDPDVVRGFEDVMARMYARHFTTGEVRAITAFYTSPAGKKMVTSMPRVMQESMPEIMAVMSPRMQAMAEKVARDVVAQVEKKGKSATTAK